MPCIIFFIFSNTKIVNIFYIILASIILIFTLTLLITINIEYDLINNEGKVKVKLYKLIVVFVSDITISDSYLNFNKKNKKVIKLKIDLHDDKFMFVNDIQTYLKHKMFPVEVYLGGVIAFENPFICSIITTITNVGVNVFLSKIKNASQHIIIENNIQIGYRQNMLKFNLQMSSIISLYDFVWAILKAFKTKVIRNEKTKRSKQSSRN